MTTASLMLTQARRAAVILAAVIAAATTGCTSAPALTPPRGMVSPYDAGRPLVWAVAPPRNESGVGFLDELALGDQLVNTVQQVRGIDALPMNRTIAAMRALDVRSIDTIADARALARAMDADAVLLSSISAWDPYTPPKIGLSLAIVPRSEAMQPAGIDDVDPIALQRAMTDGRPRPRHPVEPDDGPASVSAYLDAANHDVLMSVRAFAEGRHDTASVLGWTSYVKSMRRYTEFACHHLVETLLADERARLERAVAEQMATAR